MKFSAETILDVSSASDAIVKYSESRNAGLIVIGTKGRTGVKRVLLGSATGVVVTHASCSVLVTKWTTEQYTFEMHRLSSFA